MGPGSACMLDCCAYKHKVVHVCGCTVLTSIYVAPGLDSARFARSVSTYWFSYGFGPRGVEKLAFPALLGPGAANSCVFIGFEVLGH